MNIDYREFIVCCLAVWRLSSLFIHEDGPWNMFQRIREWAGIVHDENGVPWIVPGSFFAQLLSCVWCISVWFGAFFAVGMLLFPAITLVIAIPFALSAVAIFLNKAVRDE